MESLNISYHLTGYKAIDSQNQELFHLYNNLLSFAAIGQGAELADEVFTTLNHYATVHFSDEESFMLQYDYPDYAYQEMQHRAFIKLESQLKEEYDAYGMTNLLLAKIISFLTYWLYIHINQYDTKMTAYVDSNKELFIASNEMCFV